jgi:hypothetical protein
MSDAGNIMLELAPLASDRPVSIRLRWVLKKLLREQQFKCPGIWSRPFCAEIRKNSFRNLGITSKLAE